MKYCHLEKLDITIRALSPVFIGSGEAITKKEFIYDKQGRRVYIVDLSGLLTFLEDRSLLKSFELFLLNQKNNDLYSFLREAGITRNQYGLFCRYELAPGEVAATEKFREIQTFIKGPDGMPYIPGSSLKGALRTAIGARLAKENARGNHRDGMEKMSVRELSKKAKDLEDRLFCRLDSPRRENVKWDSIVNDFMRGLRISDSEPIPFEELTLCGKRDLKPDGKFSSSSVIFYRECLRPGAEVQMSLTFEVPVMKKAGIDAGWIEEALQDFVRSHYEKYERFFNTSGLTPDTGGNCNLILGGGAGYPSKSLVTHIAGSRAGALKTAEKIMTSFFPKHGHGHYSSRFKVSPHTLKIASYGGNLYQMGRCRLEFK